MASMPYTTRPTRDCDRSRSVARSGIRPTNQNSAETVAYVDTANTSQMSGERNWGQMFIVFGYGNSQYAASHGRPVWISGKMAAHATANSVIASANRLIDVRHDCFSRSRIAEISVPAWPIPIHQTKLTIANPHPTGMLMPQMPTPFTNRYAIETNSTLARKKANRKPTHQPTGVRRASTIELILSVTEPKVCPGAMTADVAEPTTAALGSSMGIRSSATYSPISGLTFRMAARYVVRGRVFSSPSSE